MLLLSLVMQQSCDLSGRKSTLLQQRPNQQHSPASQLSLAVEQSGNLQEQLTCSLGRLELPLSGLLLQIHPAQNNGETSGSQSCQQCSS